MEGEAHRKTRQETHTGLGSYVNTDNVLCVELGPGGSGSEEAEAKLLEEAMEVNDMLT